MPIIQIYKNYTTDAKDMFCDRKLAVTYIKQTNKQTNK